MILIVFAPDYATFHRFCKTVFPHIPRGIESRDFVYCGPEHEDCEKLWSCGRNSLFVNLGMSQRNADVVKLRELVEVRIV